MKTISKAHLTANLKFEDECARAGGKIPTPYIIAADVVKEVEMIVVVFSDKSIGALGFDALRKSHVEPNLDKVSIIDYGLTLKLGDYEIDSEVFKPNIVPVFEE